MTKQEFQGQFDLIEKMCRDAAQYRDYNPAMAVRIRTALTLMEDEEENRAFCQEHLQRQDFMACAKELVVRWNNGKQSDAENGGKPTDSTDITEKADSADGNTTQEKENVESVESVDFQSPSDDLQSSSDDSQSSSDDKSKPARRGRKE